MHPIAGDQIDLVDFAEQAFEVGRLKLLVGRSVGEKWVLGGEDSGLQRRALAKLRRCRSVKTGSRRQICAVASVDPSSTTTTG